MCAKSHRRVDLFDVNYTEIISSIAVSPDRDTLIQLYVVGNDPKTGEIITTKIFDDTVPAFTTGYAAVIQNGEIVDEATFYVIADTDAVLDITAIGFTL